MVKSKSTKSTQQDQGSASSPKSTEAMASTTMATSVPKPSLEGGLSPSGAKPTLGRSRGLVWTLYEYEKYLGVLADMDCEYIVYGYETCPTTGRKHLQGFTYFKNPHDLGAFSKKLGNAHVERQRGSHEDASKYCKKEGNFVERGTLPKQGARTDWAQALEALRTQSIVDVIESQPQLLPAQRALREVKNLFLKPLHRDVEVIVLYGTAGAGKTRWAYDNYTDIYDKPVGDWWDKYEGQKTVLLDDFYGWIKYHDLLRILDRYPYNAAYKGGYVYAQWNTVIITSNEPPNRWYKDKGLTPALRRRLNKIFKVEVIDGITHYTPQDQDHEEEENGETSSD